MKMATNRFSLLFGLKFELCNSSFELPSELCKYIDSFNTTDIRKTNRNTCKRVYKLSVMINQSTCQEKLKIKNFRLAIQNFFSIQTKSLRNIVLRLPNLWESARSFSALQICSTSRPKYHETTPKIRRFFG